MMHRQSVFPAVSLLFYAFTVNAFTVKSINCSVRLHSDIQRLTVAQLDQPNILGYFDTGNTPSLLLSKDDSGKIYIINRATGTGQYISDSNGEIRIKRGATDAKSFSALSLGNQIYIVKNQTGRIYSGIETDIPIEDFQLITYPQLSDPSAGDRTIALIAAGNELLAVSFDEFEPKVLSTLMLPQKNQTIRHFIASEVNYAAFSEENSALILKNEIKINVSRFDSDTRKYADANYTLTNEGKFIQESPLTDLGPIIRFSSSNLTPSLNTIVIGDRLRLGRRDYLQYDGSQTDKNLMPVEIPGKILLAKNIDSKYYIFTQLRNAANENIYRFILIDYNNGPQVIFTRTYTDAQRPRVLKVGPYQDEEEPDRYNFGFDIDNVKLQFMRNGRQIQFRKSQPLLSHPRFDYLKLYEFQIP